MAVLDKDIGSLVTRGRDMGGDHGLDIHLTLTEDVLQGYKNNNKKKELVL